ncbi:MAG: GTP 3',8-cyclase MoaA [Dyella sp.]
MHETSVMTNMPGALMAPVDRRGRPLRDLRISVMDRCNFRCPYCMPESKYHEHFQFLDNRQRLSFEEIERLSRLAVSLGVSKLRLTGGEPLLRAQLPELIARLRALEGVEDMAMTTNGVLLGRHASALRDAGLDRITVSLDTLDPAIFARMSGGRGEIAPVLESIAQAQAVGFPGGLKLNTVIQRGINEDGVLELLERFRGTGVVVRFIEYMDVGNHNDWSAQAIVPSRELVDKIHARWPLEAVSRQYRGEVASRYRYLDGGGEIGFISSVSEPFCGDCTRARLSSEGVLYTCLFAQSGTDLRAPMREGASDEVLLARLHGVWSQRGDRYSEERAQRRAQADASPRKKIEMHYIGG